MSDPVLSYAQAAYKAGWDAALKAVRGTLNPMHAEDWFAANPLSNIPTLGKCNVCGAGKFARISIIDGVCNDCEAASADTHPNGGDVKQAPLVSGAVPEGQTPKVQRHD